MGRCREFNSVWDDAGLLGQAQAPELRGLGFGSGVEEATAPQIAAFPGLQGETLDPGALPEGPRLQHAAGTDDQWKAVAARRLPSGHTWPLPKSMNVDKVESSSLCE